MPAQVVATLPRAWLLLPLLQSLVVSPPPSDCAIAAQQAAVEPDSGSAGPRQHLRAAGRRRQHHRLDGTRRRADGGQRSGGDGRAGAGRDPPLAESARPARQAARVGRGDAIERRGAEHRELRPSRSATSSTPTCIPITWARTSCCARSGMTFTGGNVAGNIADAAEGAAIMAHEAVLHADDVDGRWGDAAPADAQPTDTYYTDTMKLSHFFNGEGVQLIHQPSAHTDGDTPGLVSRLRRHRRRRHLFDDDATRSST